MNKILPLSLSLLGSLLCTTATGSAQEESKQSLDPSWVEQFRWRSIGPANMGGRITAISVYEKNPSIYYAATASGGLLKTVNKGITFEHQFDGEEVVSIGDVCVAQSNPDIVWVGTGEENPRNSVSYGNGVYKSVDGGKTWQHMGLKNSFQIGAVVIHPTNPDIVYVGALGRLYGPNEERGLYKTSDGGESWEKMLHIDDMTGVMEVKMNPKDPETLLVATYERERDGFDGNSPAKKIAPGSGLYRTTDGGQNFEKVTEGLPTVTLGRIGLDYYQGDPNIVYALVESELIGQAGKDVGYAGLEATDADAGAKVDWVRDEGPAKDAGLEVGDIILSVQDVTVLSNNQLLGEIAQHDIGATIELQIARAGKSMTLPMTLAERPEDGGARPRGRGARGGRGGRGRRGGGNTPFGASLGGQRANIGRQQGKNGFQHGGVYRSDDGGQSWARVNSLHARPMYFSQIRVDPSNSDNVYVLGVSASQSTDGGETFTQNASRGVHSDQHALWIDPNDGDHLIIGSDGGLYQTYDKTANWDHLNQLALGQFYHVAVGPRRDYWVYGGLQDNGTWGAPHRANRARGIINEDWIRVGGGDGFLVRVDENDPYQIYLSSQNGNTSRTHLKTQEGGRTRPQNPEGGRYRFNWETPFILSHHNSRIYYSAGSHVFRSLHKGDDNVAISPEITRTDRGSATDLTESPINPDVLYVGTDDGALYGTQDGGYTWNNLWEIPTAIGDGSANGSDGGNDSAELPAGDQLSDLVPGPRWVSSVEASRFAEGRMYMTLDAHRSDDDEPYVFVTEDFGETWSSLRANLPWGSTKAIREDRENENILYLGQEFGAYVSIDRGESWTRLNNNLPTVSVHDFAQHRSSGELLAATHGRSIWILDVTPLRQMSREAAAAPVSLYKPNDVVVWRRMHGRATSGARQFFGENPPNRAEIFYSLGSGVGAASLEIKDLSGKTIRTLEASNSSGLNHVSWDLRPTPPAGAGGFGGRGFGRGRRGGRGGGTVPTGTYHAVLTVGDEVFTQAFELQSDPNFPASSSEPQRNEEEEDGEEIDEGRK
ncbi:MAG: WD40/YVTN/BNR-like repeat-containing protein [Planctomycetota bacterium]|jgi:photosystem II stability/assembly factor-like uncharacterized protein